ncbi:MAG: 50S ribosomal protein L29 [Pseudomonadota bacterium]
MKKANKRKEWLADLRSLKAEELEIRRRDLEEEVFRLKLKAGTGQLDNPAGLKTSRKALAQVLTLLGEAAIKAEKGVQS